MPEDTRLERLAALVRTERLDAVLVTTPPNLFYFSGFRTLLYTRFNGVLWREGKPPTLITSMVDEELAKRELAGPIRVRDIRIHGPSDRSDVFPNHIDALRSDLSGAKRLGVDNISLGLFREMQAAFPQMEVVDVTPYLDALRRIKSANEVASMRHAAGIAVAAFEKAREVLARPGLAETILAAELEYRARQLGADGCGYPILISSGARIAASHAPPSPEPIPADVPFVRVAFAPNFEGYTTSVFRTFCSRNAATPAMRRYADAFFAAMAEVRSILRPGIMVRDILETISRSYTRAGLRDAWSGDAGYSLGITVQEPPRIGPSGSDAAIEAGMVLALMPGLRRASEATFHHSDVYEVTDAGCQCLSPGLQELVIYE